MSALIIRKRDRTSYPEHAMCAGACTHIGSNGRVLGKRSATHIAFICGYPAAGLCPKCAASWAEQWKAARGPMPEHKAKVAKLVARSLEPMAVAA